MQTKKVSKLISWWVTPKLPPEDIFAKHNFVSQWITHPIKRRLAKVYLSLLRRFGNIKVIGITGSTGKTTTTEILASILKRAGKTIWSAEGVDPVYNIPNTILKANLKTKFLILEMSVEYINEMDFYLWLAKPDIGVITNIATTHTKYLKSKEGVAKEKGKMIQSLSQNGYAVLNKDDDLVSSFAKMTSAKVIYFGKNAEISGTKIYTNQDLSMDFVLNMGISSEKIHINAFGNQLINNSLAASSAASALGIELPDIAQGISAFKLPKHRLNIIRSEKNGIIFDDTYNSNPKAACESLDTFKAITEGKNKIAVIGDMLELGKYEEETHRELGRKAGTIGFSSLVGVGDASRFVLEEASLKIGDKNCFLVRDSVEALEIVRPFLDKNSALFVKGSRSMHLDKLVEELI